MNRYTYAILLSIGLFMACKKEIPNPSIPPEPAEPTAAELIRADIYDYYNKYSLWTESIEDLDEEGRLAFVRKYGSNQSVLTALRGLTPNFNYRGYDYLGITPGNHYDRYSFLEEPETSNSSSRAVVDLEMDATSGYGIHLGWGILGTDDFARPVITFVEGGSPAQKAGLKRSMIVYALNDDTDITVGLTTSDRLVEADLNRVSHKLDNFLESNSLKVHVKTAETLDADEEVYTVNYSSSYVINPVTLDSVYTYPDKNIGYMAYSSFEEEYRGYGVDWDRMERIFANFEQKQVEDLILDLRYNTGGYVETARYLANKLVPSAANGELMFSYEVNDYLKPYTETASRDFDFRPVDFEKEGKLELKHLYVLVTEQTASAAELLINVLRPHMDVTLIGDTDRTYGKPVGFFPEEIGDITLWVTSFETINSAGFSDYWNGLPFVENKDIAIANDYFFKDFGDTSPGTNSEDMLVEALRKIGVVPEPSMRASLQKSTATGARSLGIINKVRQRNMLKTR